jgi:hypothetical protein
MKKYRLPLLTGLLAAIPALALAEDAPVSEMTYILNTFSFLMNGVLVMWMAAGFGMLESGLVRADHVLNVLGRLQHPDRTIETVAKRVTLRHPPVSDPARYDALREADHVDA